MAHLLETTTYSPVYQIELEKPVSGGLGISLVTAESRNQTGVFIRTITQGGVADIDGRLEVGDQILQVKEGFFLFTIVTNSSCVFLSRGLE